MKKTSLLVLGVVVGLLLGLAVSAGAANVLPPARVDFGAAPGTCYKMIEQGLADEVQGELSGYLSVLQEGPVDGTMGHVVRMTELIMALYEAPLICPPTPRVSR